MGKDEKIKPYMVRSVYIVKGDSRRIIIKGRNLLKQINF